jgi:hypothetical protein
MTLIDIKIPSTRDLRLFGGLWLPLTLAFFAGLLFWKSGARISGTLLALAALSISAIGWTVPEALRPLHAVWMAVVFPVGWIVSHVLLAAVFFLLFAPIALLLRAAGADPLQLRPKREAGSYWKQHAPPPPVARYFRQS